MFEKHQHIYLPIPPKKFALLLFFTACALRLFTFFFYIQHHERYQQPDSMDYHNCALGIFWGTGMHRADTMEPIFWRTPGYPVYLAIFYALFPKKTTGFQDWKTAHTVAIVIQILLCSLIPILIWILAFLLTNNNVLATIAAWITVVHPGFILASTYILTEGLAVFFFCIFLILFYQQLRATGQQNFSYLALCGSVLALSIYTWMRPMGQFIAVITLILMIFTSQDQWQLRVRKTLIFGMIFFATLVPWYLRNHTLTGQWFFCPMSGPYLNSFCAPKIVRTVKGISLEDSIRMLYSFAHNNVIQAKKALEGTGYHLARETVCNAVAWPIICAYPLIFLKDWAKEVIKTSFDLYSYQFVACATNVFRYDPLEEFLSEKLAACLYAASVPWWIRAFSYLELLYSILLWIGLFLGIWLFMCKPVFHYFTKKHLHHEISQLSILWWQAVPLIAATLVMTGGFGYARLRLPVEGLMIILSLTWCMYTTSKN